MDISLELRRAFPILRDLPEEELRSAPVVRVFKATGERFFDQGDPGDAVYGVVQGRVRIFKQTVEGRELTLDIFGPGDLVAAVAVLRGTPMPASVVALEPTTCLKIDGEWFKRVMHGRPELATRTLDVVMSRLVEAGTSRLRLATDPVEARLAAALLRMANKFGNAKNGEIRIERTFTRQHFADLAGTTVETTIRVMSRWTKEGWIATDAGFVCIRKPEELEKLAGS